MIFHNEQEEIILIILGMQDVQHTHINRYKIPPNEQKSHNYFKRCRKALSKIQHFLMIRTQN
jgi:hypothetical protein